jgi:hypothetical protein
MELRNWEPYGLQSSAYIIGVMKSGKLQWAWHVTCGVGGRRDMYQGVRWVGLKERDRLEDRDIIRGYIEMGRRGLNFTQDRMAGRLLET